MPKWFTDLTSAQWWAGSRQYITFFAGIICALLGVGATQQQDLLKSMMDFITASQQFLIALGTLLTAVIAIINAWKSAHNAGPEATIQKAKEMAADPLQPKAIEAKTAILAAAASLPEVKKGQPAIILDKNVPNASSIAAALPSNVVAH